MGKGFIMEKNNGIQIELENGETTLKISMGADVSSSKIKAVKEMISPFSSNSTSSQKRELSHHQDEQRKKKNKKSLFYRLKVLVANVFRYGQIFTSKDVREAFEEIFGDKINPSTCSTYLRRMEQASFLKTVKEGRVIEYRLSKSEIELPSLDELEKNTEKEETIRAFNR